MHQKKSGQVIKSTGSWYKVLSNEELYECKIRGKLRLKNSVKSTNPIAVGDFVDFKVDTQKREAVIYNIHERKNYIIRKSTNLSSRAHIIAANVDQALVVVTLSMPKTELVFIDRILAACEAYNIPASLVFNKTDIYDKETYEMMRIYQYMYADVGYASLSTSVKTKEGIEDLKGFMKGKLNVFVGNSGVGKSSLINSIAPELDLKTTEISNAHLGGKHTTTFAEMFETNFGAYIIDTPGIRAFGLYDFDKSEIAHFFKEIFKIGQNCKFNNCTHTHEPGCAVLQALDEDKISPTRYHSYLNILNDDEGKYREDIYK